MHVHIHADAGIVARFSDVSDSYFRPLLDLQPTWASLSSRRRNSSLETSTLTPDTDASKLQGIVLVLIMIFLILNYKL
jgi:hypothetical protein